MKTDNALKKYCSKRFAAISSLINKPKSLFTEEDFHLLRVEIKKLHAFFNLINSSEKGFSEKSFYKPFKKVFEQAGKIRELQLQGKMLKKYDPTHSIKNYPEQLKSKELIEKEKMFPTTKLSDKLKKIHKDIDAFIKKAEKKKAINYVNNLQNKIEKLRGKELKTSQVHELRKLLKEFYYDSKSLKMPKENAKEKKADKLQDLMGEWHDYCVMDDCLKKEMNKNNLSPAEVTYLKNVEAKVSVKSEMLLKKINTAKDIAIV